MREETYEYMLIYSYITFPQFNHLYIVCTYSVLDNNDKGFYHPEAFQVNVTIWKAGRELAISKKNAAYGSKATTQSGKENCKARNEETLNGEEVDEEAFNEKALDCEKIG